MEALFEMWKIIEGLDAAPDDSLCRRAFGAGLMAAACPGLIGVSVSDPRFQKMVHDFAFPDSEGAKLNLPS